MAKKKSCVSLQLGISETSFDIRDLLAQESSDVREAEAVGRFCYQTKKWIGAFAAASFFGGNKFSFFLIMRSLVR